MDIKFGKRLKSQGKRSHIGESYPVKNKVQILYGDTRNLLFEEVSSKVAR